MASHEDHYVNNKLFSLIITVYIAKTANGKQAFQHVVLETICASGSIWKTTHC